MRSLSFSHLTALDIAPPDLIDFTADAGFHSTGIRLSPAVVGGIAYPLEIDGPAFKQTVARLQTRNMRVLDIEVLRIDGETDIASFVPVIEAGAQLGASRLCVNGEDPNLNRFTEKWSQLCTMAAGYGMEVDLEFMVWRPIRTFQIAAKVVQEAGCRNGKVLIDALHLFRSGGTVDDVRAADPGLIGALQLCDAPWLGPDVNDTPSILAEARAGRLPPLEGELPLVELIQAVPGDTPIGVEVPMGPLSDGRFADLPARVAHIRQVAERCLQLAG
jgi:sugar phosphate isomerase/epimerase